MYFVDLNSDLGEGAAFDSADYSFDYFGKYRLRISRR